MKFLKILLVTLITFITATAGVLYFLQDKKERGYIDIYGEDETAY